MILFYDNNIITNNQKIKIMKLMMDIGCYSLSILRTEISLFMNQQRMNIWIVQKLFTIQSEKYDLQHMMTQLQYKKFHSQKSSFDYRLFVAEFTAQWLSGKDITKLNSLKKI